jgi:hypothetical protein
MTVFSIVREVAAEIGVLAPSSMVGNIEITAARFLAASKAAGISLARAHNWTILQREHTFTTTADVANYAVPEDWYKPLGETAWDRDQFRRMRGNMSAREWQILKGQQVTADQFRRRYRLVVGPLAGSILLHPTPSDAYDLVIEYVSSYWVQSAAAAGQSTIEADTDDVRLDHELYRLGLLWRMKRSLGMPYADDRNDYDLALRDAIKADINLPVICLAPASVEFDRLHVPDGSFDDGS